MRDCLITLIIIKFSFLAFCQSDNLKFYNFENGLPFDKVYFSDIDKNGMIHIGTQKGIYSFDGQNYQHYPLNNLTDSHILRVEVDSQKRIWFRNFSKQFGYIQNGICHILKDTLFNGKVVEFAVHDSEIIIDVRLDDDYNKFIILDLEQEIILNEIEIAKEKKLRKHYYLGSDILSLGNDYYYTLGKESYRLPKSLKLQEEIIQTSNIEFPKKVFLRTGNKGLYYFSKNTFFRKENEKVEAKEIIDFDILDLIPIEDGFLIISVEHKLFWLNKKNEFIEVLQPNCTCNKVNIKSYPSIWISTNNCGLLRINDIKKSTNTNFNYLTNDPKNEFVSLLNNDSKNILVGDNHGKLYNKSNTEILHLISDYKNEIRGYTQINDSIKIIGTLSNLYLENGNKTTKVSCSVKNIITTRNSIYIASHKGLIKLNKSDLINNPNSSIESLENIILYGPIYCVAKNEFSNTIYITNKDGISKIEEDSIITQLFDGTEYYLRNIFVTKNNKLIVNVPNKGIFQYQENNLVLITNLTSDLYINSIKQSKADNAIYISANSGLYRIDLALEKIKKLNDSTNALAGPIFDCAIFENKITYINSKGVFSISKSEIEIDESNLYPFISQVSVNDQAISALKNIRLDYDQNNISILLNAPNYDNKNKTIYNYKINNSQKNWTASSSNEIKLNELKPGKYSFSYYASNGIINSAINNPISFEIKKPWWSSNIFFIGCLIISGLCIFLITTIFKNHKEKNNKIKLLKMQVFQNQLNPHFTANYLTFLQGQILANDTDSVLSNINKFGAYLRNVFNLKNHNTHSLNDEILISKKYFSLLNTKQNGENSLIFEIAKKDQLSIKKYSVPPLLFQPLIENSFTYRDHDRILEIIIYIKLIDNTISIKYTDNGIGISSDFKLKKQNSGLNIFTKRIELFNGNKMNSKVDIKKNKETKGVNIEFKLQQIN